MEIKKWMKPRKKMQRNTKENKEVTKKKNIKEDK